MDSKGLLELSRLIERVNGLLGQTIWLIRESNETSVADMTIVLNHLE